MAEYMERLEEPETVIFHLSCLGQRPSSASCSWESRLKIPSSNMAVGATRVFVKTGPGWDSVEKAEEIRVDIIQGRLPPVIQ